MQLKSKHYFYRINWLFFFNCGVFFFPEMSYTFTWLSMGIDFCFVSELKEDKDNEISA